MGVYIGVPYFGQVPYIPLTTSPVKKSLHLSPLSLLAKAFPSLFAKAADIIAAQALVVMKFCLVASEGLSEFFCALYDGVRFWLQDSGLTLVYKGLLFRFPAVRQFCKVCVASVIF